MDFNPKQKWSLESFYKRMCELQSAQDCIPEQVILAFSRLKHLSKSKVVFDSEHGINGNYYIGSVEIWNTSEFSPWQIAKPITMVLGNLTYIDDRDDNQNLALLEILNGAKVFVSGDLNVSNLFISEGQLYCLGKVEVTDTLSISEKSFLAAEEITCQKYEAFGRVQCDRIHFKAKISY